MKKSSLEETGIRGGSGFTLATCSGECVAAAAERVLPLFLVFLFKQEMKFLGEQCSSCQNNSFSSSGWLCWLQ